MSERYLKQVIVIRRDLDMPVGKVAAMAAHAAMTFIVNMAVNGPYDPLAVLTSDDQWRWLTELDPGLEDAGQVSMAKIVVFVQDEAELREVESQAQAHGLTVHRVVDSGYAHNKAGTWTCIAIGPHWPEQLQPVTGHLKTR